MQHSPRLSDAAGAATTLTQSLLRRPVKNPPARSKDGRAARCDTFLAAQEHDESGKQSSGHERQGETIMKRKKHQKRRRNTTLHLTEFERQTLAYLLYALRVTSAPDQDDAVIASFDDTFSPEEFHALWALGLRLMRKGRKRA